MTHVTITREYEKYSVKYKIRCFYTFIDETYLFHKTLKWVYLKQTVVNTLWQILFIAL